MINVYSTLTQANIFINVFNTWVGGQKGQWATLTASEPGAYTVTVSDL